MENEVNSTKLIIKKVEVFDESVYGSNNGKLLITLNGENVNSSLYKISYGLHTATNLFNSNGHKAINNTIVFDNIKNGEYFNLYITKLSDNTISNVVLGFFTKSAIRSIADNNQNTNAVATLCPSINFTDCAGAAKTVTNFNTESAGNIQGSYNPCGFEIGTTCAVTKVSQWHCIDGNLSLPAAFSVYTKTNYVGVGLTALQACRLNYIVCNYVFNASGVADAVWYITGTGGSNTAVAQAAVNAVPAVNGTQDLMTFYKYPNGTAQDMIDWTCRSVDNCTCPNNLVVNPSFESGTTGWSWSGGTLSAGNGAAKCGNYSGDFQISNTATNWVSQTVGTDLPVGTVINASVWAGTHNNSINHKVLIEFFDANWNWISGTYVDVNKVLSTAPAGPQLYTLSGVVPPGCKYSNIGFNGNGDWIKTDQWCVTTAAPTTVALGNEVFVDTNGNGVKDGGDWGYDGVLVKLYLDANQDNVPDGAALASQTTSGGGKYNFSNLAPGNYMVQIENAPSWMFVVPRNGGDPDNNIDNDNNGLSQATTTIKGGTITLSVGGEPGSSSYNPTYDFAIYKNNGLGDFVF